MKGLLESIAFCLAPRNKSAVLATITKEAAQNLRMIELAKDGYQDVINGVGNENPIRPSMDCATFSGS